MRLCRLPCVKFIYVSTFSHLIKILTSCFILVVSVFTFISPPGSLSGLSVPVSCFPPGHVHFPRLRFCLYVLLSSTQSFVSVSFIISCVSELVRFGFGLFLQCFSWLYPVFSNLDPELCMHDKFSCFLFCF